MKKIWVALITVSFILFCLDIPSFAKSNKKIFITAESAILVDLTRNRILYSKNIHNKCAPASTIKILTALVALEGLGTQKEVEVSKKANGVQPSKIWLSQYATYNSLDLINAVLISSANDASVALAEAAAGTEAEFAKIMNKKAMSLGAKHSNFINASGLPAENQYSTAYDLYRITKTAFKNSIIYKIMKKKRETIKDSSGKEIKLINHNKLLFRKSYPLVLGKTGYTKSARHCYAGIAYFDKKEYAIVILKSRKPWDDIEKLLGLVKN